MKHGAQLTAPTVTRTGYTFREWSPEVPGAMPTLKLRNNHTAKILSDWGGYSAEEIENLPRRAE